MTSLLRDDTYAFTPFTSRQDFRDFIAATKNWGRWGADDQNGTLNLITPEKRAAAARLVTEGLAVSMSMPLATKPAGNNPYPVHHYMEVLPRGDALAGSAHDYFTVSCHGTAMTHLDALTHVWDDDGMLYNGVSAAESVTFDGARWGALDTWRTGIFTRCVLLDVAMNRTAGYVTEGAPVTPQELQDTLDRSGLTLSPGDAVAVYCGRERWDTENPTWSAGPTRPGLDVSCIKFLRKYDAALLAWDMTEQKPIGHDLPWGVHVVIPAYGMALLDSAYLADAAATCHRLGRYEFLLTLSPLYLRGGTGSPVNPIATF